VKRGLNLNGLIKIFFQFNNCRSKLRVKRGLNLNSLIKIFFQFNNKLS